MIKGFVDKETEKVYRGEFSKKLPPDIQKPARRKLIYLDEADTLQDLLAPPGNRLEALTPAPRAGRVREGKRAGQHRIRINDQWRIVFRWKTPHAYEVEITDYHS